MNSEEAAPFVRADGHILLLMEPSPGHRTFSDYQNIDSCLRTIVVMYEEYRDAFNEDLGGDLKDFQKWIDNFHAINLYEYDKDIGRYKHFKRENLKKMFERNDDNEANHNNSPAQNGTANSIDNATSRLNGFSINGTNHRDNDDDDSDDDDEENWDD